MIHIFELHPDARVPHVTLALPTSVCYDADPMRVWPGYVSAVGAGTVVVRVQPPGGPELTLRGSVNELRGAQVGRRLSLVIETVGDKEFASLVLGDVGLRPREEAVMDWFRATLDGLTPPSAAPLEGPAPCAR